MLRCKAELGVARDEAASATSKASAVNMAEDLLETVDRLQSRLQENQEPRKLVKALRKLGELPMTVEILVETGVGKAVNSLRKHDIVGELAKSLVAKWKKLVPQTTDRSSNSHHTKPQSHRAEERGHKRVRDPSPEPSPEPTYDQDQEEEDEEEGYNPNYSPDYGSPQRNSYQSDEYDSPQPEPSPPPPPPPPRKDPKPSSKPNKEVHKNHHHSRERAEERRPGSSDRREGKKREPERGRRDSPEQKTPKPKKSTAQEPKREEKKSQGNNDRPRAPKDSPTNGEEDEFETPSMSFESFLTYDAPAVKKKKKPTPSAPPPSSSSSSSHSRPAHTSSSSSSSRPSAPPSSSSQSSSSSSSSKAKKSNGSSKRAHSSSKSSSGAAPEKRRKQAVEPVPTLPDIPLPAIQPNYRPLPSIDVTPLSPQRRKVALCTDEEDAGFTGKRLNSKMVVFSGSKTSYLPRMMTLYEQCIRVLQNNIDSIAEVGGVPFEILEPVLERCTPEQLYRIEQSNQWFTEDSDELWMRHCQRDFKREQPQEYESWRELYLRLHDEREERLRLLTQNITSAHANKPKGRQVKMAFVNSVAKPPRDVRRRQEKFGTSSGSSAASTVAASPIKVRPVFTAEPSEPSRSSSSSSSSHSSLSSAPRPFALGGGSSAAASARDKPQVKKIAPMMAKTIKAFKNRFSRR